MSNFIAQTSGMSTSGMTTSGMSEQSNYFIIDSFFSVKSTITDLLAATPRPYQVQGFNKATIQSNSPQLSKESRSAMKVRGLLMHSDGGSADPPAVVNYDTLHIKFPEYFIESGNPNKRIEVEICRLYDMTSTDAYTGKAGVEMSASMHSDIWNVNDSADHYICSTNTLYNNPKCYTVGDNRSVFEIWFYRPDGSVIDLDPVKTRAVIEFVLKY